jgi:type I restriction enzyme S subunit
MATKYKDSGVPWIGMIPSDWKVVRTKNVFACSKSLVGEDWSHTQLLSLTTKGVKEVAIGSTSGKVPDSYETYQVVNKDDLVMCLFDLDCSAVFSGVSNFHGMISPAYKVLKTLDGYFPAFYGYWFDYIFDGRKYKYLSKNIRYSLTYDEFAALGIAAPPLATQQRIADYLDRKCAEIDELADLQQTMIDELKRYKQSVITEAVTKGLNKNAPMKDSGVEWIGEIPEGWDVRKCGRVFKENVRLPQKGDISLSLSQVDGLIPTSEMKEKAMLTSTYEGWKRVVVNDLVLNRFKAHLGVLFASKYVGMVSFHYGVYEALVELSPKYFEYLFHSHQYKLILAGASNGMVVGLQNLSNSNFYKVLCLFPPLAEQRAIAAYLDEKCAEIDELIAVKQQKIEALKEYKKSVIFEYVTGKKEVEK